MPVKKEKAAPKKKAVKKEEAPVPQKDCEHCEGNGKCTLGEPYDPGHHQSFGAKIRLTSCMDCLEAAGEHHNSEKLVKCRICGGTGKVPQ